MYEFIEGSVIERSPAHVVLHAGSIGFYIHISIHTYSSMNESGQCRLYIHEVIREDAHLLFGFYQKDEREIFRQLIAVSGIGANTARLILSSMGPREVEQAILEENVYALQSIKGIGAKTAQRVIIELKDRIGKSSVSSELFSPERNTIREESLNALVALGFQKKNVEKVIGNILSKKSALTVEELIKQALKML
jgi:holliday junction DNA helicase RuvA